MVSQEVHELYGFDEDDEVLDEVDLLALDDLDEEVLDEVDLLVLGNSILICKLYDMTIKKLQGIIGILKD